MIILIKLFIAHMLGDFLLQPKKWVVEKEKCKIKSIKFYVHILTHGLLILLVLWDLNYWLLALILMFLHGIIDLIKLYSQTENSKSKWFFIDQGLHILSIIILWIVLFNPELNLILWFENTSFWIYIIAILCVTFVSGIVVRECMSQWSQSLNEGNDESLNNAGKYIGILERLFVFIFVITGNWEGIGFLLAAKSVFRFGDLKESKDRKLTEYILIGTLISFGIAIGVGMFTLKLIEIV